MPALDRRIVVRVSVHSRNKVGELVEAHTDYPVWASVADLSALDTEEAGGVFTEAIRKWTVRYRAEFVAATTDALSVLDGGETYNVRNVVEQRERDERRRFIMIEGVAVP